jgi:hypothetical protein
MVAMSRTTRSTALIVMTPLFIGEGLLIYTVFVKGFPL